MEEERVELWVRRYQALGNVSLDLVNTLAPFCLWYASRRNRMLAERTHERKPNKQAIAHRWNEAMRLMARIVTIIGGENPELLKDDALETFKVYDEQSSKQPMI